MANGLVLTRSRTLEIGSTRIVRYSVIEAPELPASLVPAEEATPFCVRRIGGGCEASAMSRY
jgi:hypothetical protein